MSESRDTYEQKPSQEATIHTPTEAERQTGKIAAAVAGVVATAGFVKFSLATDFVEFMREAEHSNLVGSLFYGAAAVSAGAYSFLVMNTKVREHDDEIRKQNDLMTNRRSDSAKRKLAATAFVVSTIAAGAQETGAINALPGFSSEASTESVADESGDATADRGTAIEVNAELPVFSVGECEIITPITGESNLAVDSMGRLQWGLNEAGFANDVTGFQLDGRTNQALGDFKNEYSFEGLFDGDMCLFLDNLVGGELTDGRADTPNEILDLPIYQN